MGVGKRRGIFTMIERKLFEPIIGEFVPFVLATFVFKSVMKKPFLLSIFWLAMAVLGGHMGQAEPIRQEWKQHFEAEGHFDPLVLRVDHSDNVISAGAVTDESGARTSYIVKHRGNDGTTLWSQSLKGRLIVDLAIDLSNNIFVTGLSLNGGDTYCFVGKCRGADGGLLWEKSFVGTKPSLSIDSQNNVVITASINNKWYIAKYAGTDGEILWEAINDLTGSPSVGIVDASDDIIVAGIIQVSRWPFIDYYYHIIKHSGLNGRVIWQRSDSCGYFSPEPISAIDTKGNPFLAIQPDAPHGDYIVVKYKASDGSVVWERKLGRKVEALVADSQDNVIVAGSPNYHTVKYSAIDGSIIWENTFENDGQVNAMAINSQNDIILTGSSGYTIKYRSSDGAIVWRKRHYYKVGAGNIFGLQNRDVAVDSVDDVIVLAGDTVSRGSPQGTWVDDLIVIKYIDDPPLPPTLNTNPAEFVTYRAANLCASVSPNGDVTVVWFEFGTSISYGKTTTPEEIGSNWESVRVCQYISANELTTYHFRAVASNIRGTIYGEDMSFTTPESPDPCLAFPPGPQREACYQLGELFQEGGGGGCFIATAAYGSYLHPHVKALRKFRDQYLMTNRIGRTFIRLYYTLSLPLAKSISRHQALRLTVRFALIPLVWTVKYPLIASLVVIVAMGFVFYRKMKPYRGRFRN